MTNDDLAEGRRLLAEALPGPWCVPSYNEAEIRLRRAAFLSEPWVNLDIEVGVYGAKQVTPCTVGDVPTAQAVAWLRNYGQALLDAAEERNLLRKQVGSVIALGKAERDRLLSELKAAAERAQKAEDAPAEEAVCVPGGNYGLCKTHLTCEMVRKRLQQAEVECERLNRMIRETGQGQEG